MLGQLVIQGVECVDEGAERLEGMRVLIIEEGATLEAEVPRFHVLMLLYQGEREHRGLLGKVV